MRAYVIEIRKGKYAGEGEDCTLYPLNKAKIYSAKKEAEKWCNNTERVLPVDITLAKKRKRRVKLPPGKPTGCPLQMVSCQECSLYPCKLVDKFIKESQKKGVRK